MVLFWQESLCGPVVIGGTLCLCFYVTLNVWVCESPLSTVCVCVCVRARARARSCLTLCHPVDCSLPRSLCRWNSSGKNTGLGCVSLSKRSFRPGDRTHISCSSCTGRQFFTTVPPGKPPRYSICLSICVCICFPLVTQVSSYSWLTACQCIFVNMFV